MSVWNAECFVALANAIIQSAANDYTSAYKTLMMNPNNREAKWRLEECQRFFRSTWYQRLTTFDGELMMELLERQCWDERKKKSKKRSKNRRGI
ncbi:MAG: hypothetical protein IIV14_00785 [Bacteroidaceae bacterium]|nr:hypothetical protein [Bacteroidaceae bacterium]